MILSSTVSKKKKTCFRSEGANDLREGRKDWSLDREDLLFL